MGKTASTHSLLTHAIDAAIEGKMDKAISLIERQMNSKKSSPEETMGLYRLLIEWNAQIGHYLQARSYAGQAVEFGMQHFGPRDEDVLLARNSELYWMCEIGLDALASRRFPALIEDVRASLGEDSPLMWAVRTNSAMPAKARGDYRLAVDIYRGIVVDMAEVLDPDDVLVLTAHDNLAEALALAGQHEEAIIVYSSLRAKAAHLWGADDWRVIRLDAQIVESLYASGEEESAVRLCDEAQKRADRALGTHHPVTVSVKTLRLTIALERKEKVRARELCHCFVFDPPPLLTDEDLHEYARLLAQLEEEGDQ